MAHQVDTPEGSRDGVTPPPTTWARVLHPALVGRDSELVAIEEQVEQVLSGAFRVVLLRGAAGVGKSRLAAEVLARHAENALCLSARSYRWGAAASFGAWIEALDRHLRTQSPEELEGLFEPRPDLAVLLATVASARGVPQREPDRGRLLEALVELFDRLCVDRPVLVLLDDIHLADSSSWEALRYLGRRLGESPIGVVATARPEDLTRRPIVTEVLVGLNEDALMTPLDLRPLTATEIAALAHQVLRADPRVQSAFVPAALVSWLLERSMGHPLFVIGLLRALIDEGADLVAPQLERLPTSLRERIALEVDVLADEHRRVLEALAVVDRRIEVRDLERVADQSREQLAQSLEALVRSGLVTDRLTGGELSFEISHPIVQGAIYEAIGSARRLSLHRTVGRTLLTSGHLGTAAGHLARSAGPGDNEAIDALCQTMVQAEARGFYLEAIAVLDALLDVLPADDDRWLVVLEAMDWQSEWVLSHLAENDAATAIAAMERIDTHLRGKEDLAARATVQFHLAAFLSFGAGQLAQAERACRTAIDLFARAGAEERSELARNELAWIRGGAGDLDHQAELAIHVAEGAERAGRQRAATHAAGTAAYALGLLGRFLEAERLFDRSVELAHADGNHYRIAWAQAQRGCMLSLCGRLEEALNSVDSAFECDRRAPDAIAYEDLAHGLWLAGRLEEALDNLDRSAIRRHVQGSRRRAWGSALAARLHAEMGRPGRARTSLDQAISTYRGERFLVWGFWSSWTDGLLTWQKRGPEAAVTTLDEVAAELAKIGSMPYEALVLIELAEVAVETGDPERVEQTASRLQEIARRLDTRLHWALARLGAGHAHLAMARMEHAAEEAAEAAAVLGSRGYTLHAASAEQLLGRARRTMDRPGSVEALQGAADTFDRCGAIWRRDRVLAELPRLGSRGRRAAASVRGPTALTPRERQVAALAARGYTAEEVAQTLFIGRRTVESHLASSYAKLGVASKRELMKRRDEMGL